MAHDSNSVRSLRRALPHNERGDEITLRPHANGNGQQCYFRDLRLPVSADRVRILLCQLRRGFNGLTTDKPAASPPVILAAGPLQAR